MIIIMNTTGDGRFLLAADVAARGDTHARGHLQSRIGIHTRAPTLKDGRLSEIIPRVSVKYFTFGENERM